MREAIKMNPWAVSYEMESSDGALSLIVASNGECQLTRTGSFPWKGQGEDPEIGFYYYRLDQGVAESMRKMVIGLVDESPGKIEAAKPGTLFLTFGYFEEAKSPRTRSFPRNRPLPPSAERAEKSNGEIVTEMLKHPVQTLKAFASWELPEISGNQQVNVRVKLRNSGTMPIRIRNPAAAHDDRSIGLHLLIEKDVPPDELTMVDQASPTIRRNMVAQVSAPGSKEGNPPSPVVKLEPNQELVLSIGIKSNLYLGRGRYRGVVNYESMTAGIPKEEAVPGRLRIQTGTLTVKGR